MEQEVLELQEVVPDLASLALLACPSFLAVGTETVRRVLGSVYPNHRYLHARSRKENISWVSTRMIKMKRLTCGERRWDLAAIGVKPLFRS